MARRAGSSELPVASPLAALLLAVPLYGGAGELSVTAVRFWSLADVTRIAIETTGTFTYRTDRLNQPDRVFFDLRGVKPALSDKGLHIIPVNDSRVRQVRVAETQPFVTRIVIDLGEGRPEIVTSQLSVPDRLMVEVRGKVSEPAAPVLSSSGVRKIIEPSRLVARNLDPPVFASKPAAAVPPALPAVDWRNLAPAPEVAAIADSGKGEVAKAGPSGGPKQARRNSNGDRSLTRVLGLKVRRIVIDPGHGGHDHGTTGPGGLVEKELTLDIAKRLAGLVEESMGSEAILTRDQDRFVELEDRAAVANHKKADLFISIHANSSPIRTAAGAETYMLSFTASKSAMEVAARENAASERSISELKELLQKIALKDKLDESRELAAKVQNSLVQLTSNSLPPQGKGTRRDRGIKRAPFVVLIGAQMPAILTEIGFVTNSKEEALLKKPEYRQKIAESILKGLQNYAETLGQMEVAVQTRRRAGSE
ncbi:MAG: N-acetylmuramoyl-L-alanine amidase [Bryobacterales bacterium]|nr:N-acetylmuramoyl-L-alanine amidase [Bryobacterales bacterium]